MRKFICVFACFLLANSLCVVESQQTNSFDTVSYTPNAFHRNNFCDLHYKVESGEMELKDALRGKNISVGLFRYQLEEDSEGRFRINELNPGPGIQFMDALASRAGFTWRDSFGILDSPKADTNQTWSGLLRWSVDTYDVVGDWYLRTLERLGGGIAFPEGWYDGSLIMVRKKPEENYETNIWAFLDPFTAGVWYLIIGTTFASGVVFYLLDFINTGGDKGKMELKLGESVYVSSLSMVGNLIHLPSRGSSQFFSFSVCFLSLLIVTAYTANLASFLIVRNAPSIVITDITDAIKDDLSFCVLRSSTSETTLRKDYKAARIVQKDSIGDTYLAVLEGECDLVLTTVGTWNRNERNAKYNKDCSLEWVGRVVKPFAAGFSLRDSAMLCSSVFRDALSLHMIDMKLERDGLKIWDQIINEKATIMCIEDGSSDTVKDEDKEKLSLTNIGGLFVVHLVVTTVAVVLTAFK